jgi:hypothetical protein
MRLLSENKISPMDRILPGFQKQAREMASSSGAASSTREGRLAMLNILYDLDIIDDSVVRMFKNDPSVSRMVDYFEANGISQQIKERQEEVQEYIKNQLENKISFTTGNRSDDAARRYEVNKLSQEIKAARKAAKKEQKPETAAALSSIAKPVDMYSDLVGSIKGSYSDDYMLEIAADPECELDDIMKMVRYLSKFVDESDIDVDGRRIDVSFGSDTKLGKIISKMGVGKVESQISSDLQSYGGAGVVIHEPDKGKEDMLGDLRAPIEDEEYGFGEEENEDDMDSFDMNEGEGFDPDIEEGEEGDDDINTTNGDDFESLAQQYEENGLAPEVLDAQKEVLRRLAGKTLNDSYTTQYMGSKLLTEKKSQPTKLISFRDKYKPKTSYQLEELRGYGY